MSSISGIQDRDFFKFVPEGQIPALKQSILDATDLVPDLMPVLVEFLTKSYIFGASMWAHYLGDVGKARRFRQISIQFSIAPVHFGEMKV